MPKAARKRRHIVEEQPIVDDFADVEERPTGNTIDFEKIILASNIITGSGEGTSSDVVASQGSSMGPSLPTLPNLPASLVRLSDDDLSAHVPQAIREQIQKGGFTNLALLLKGSIELQEFASGSTLRINESGQIEVKPRECKEKIANIEKWTDAFLIFSAIYLTTFPNRTKELLHYMFNIRESARKGGFAWRAYDEQFRLRQAVNPSSWAHINPDLWWRCTLSSEPANQIGPVPPPRKYTCHEFNKGSCRWPSCRFGHTCSACGGQHPAVSCHRESNPLTLSRSPAAYTGRQPNFRGRGRPFYRGARQ